MWLRLVFAVFAYVLSVAALAAGEKPYRVSLVGDRFDGEAWHMGVLIALDPGWKTYWRMPGEAGIPPEFTWTASVPADIEVLYPVPSRHVDQSGEAVGYEGNVLFPVTVRAGGATSAELKLSLFFAVCKDICIPASAEAAITLGPRMTDAEGAERVDAALKQVPVQGKAIESASMASEGGKPQLVLGLREKPDDIFVETAGPAYFRAPAFSPDGSQARLAIDNLKDPAALSGAELKLTYRIAGRGFEQAVKLP